MRDLGLTLFAFFATAWIHAMIGYLLVRALIAVRAVRRPASREIAWRMVMFAPFATAALQLFAQDVVITQRWSVHEVAQAMGATITLPDGAARESQRSDAAGSLETARAARALDAARAAPSSAGAASAMAPDATVSPRDGDAPANPGSAVTASSDSTPSASQSKSRERNAGEPNATEHYLVRSDAIPADTIRSLLAVAGWAWLAISLLMLARYTGLARAARRRASGLAPVADAAYQHAAADLAYQLDTAPIDLRRDDALDSPVALAPNHVCIPGWMLAALGPAQRDAMLAHEISHHSRHDPAWRFAQACAAATLPLRGARHARRQLDDLAELACDARAATLTGQGRALAECLAMCAEHGRSDTRPAFAVAMAHSRSPLLDRVRRLLEEHHMPYDFTGRARGALFLVAAVTAAVVLPGFSQDAAEARQSSGDESKDSQYSKSSARWNFDFGFGNHTRVRTKTNGHEFALDSHGEFTFNESETDIATLDNELEIEETRDGVTRAIAFEKDGTTITREYSVDGDERPYDAEAQRWLASIIPQVYRQTGIDADKRVDRFYARGGADAVLDEIALIESDYVAGKYLGRLFGKGALSAAQLDRAVAAAGKIDSDYERRQALVAALESQQLDADGLVAVIGLAGKLDSDYERREVLVAAAPALSNNGRAQTAWFDALDQGSSDYERRVAVQTLFESTTLEPALFARALESTLKFDSDYEHREALTAIVPRLDGSDANVAAFARSVRGIDSDYEQRVALEALFEKVELSVDGATAVLDSLDGMDSSHELGNVLAALAARMPADDQLIKRYRVVARRLGDHERGQAERALDRFAMI